MSTSFFGKYIVPEAAKLRNSDSYRTIPPIDDGAAREILYSGTRLLNLASNNYLGLAGHPELIEASAKALAATAVRPGPPGWSPATSPWPKPSKRNWPPSNIRKRRW